MGRPMSPRPIKPMAGFKKDLLKSSRRERAEIFAGARRRIVAEFARKSREGEAFAREASGCLRARKDAGSAARSGASRSAERLIRGWFRVSDCFGRSRGRRSRHTRVHGSASIRLSFNSDKVLIGNFPAEMPMLPALFEHLFEENGAAGISDERARSGQDNIAGAKLHIHLTPQKRRVSSHLPASVGVR